MPYIISKAKQYEDQNMVKSLFDDYRNWLLMQPRNKLYQRQILNFLSEFVQRSNSKFLTIFYPNGKKADQIMKNPYFSSNVVDRIIANEDVNPKLGVAGTAVMLGLDTASPKFEPQWQEIYNTVKVKYNSDYAERAVLNGKIKWYEYFRMNKECTETRIVKLKKFGADYTNWENVAEVNDIAWKIFLKSNDLKELTWAVKLMSKVLKGTGNIEFHPKVQWDTYANLLYKVGKVKEAIKWEQKVLNDLLELNNSYFDPYIANYNSTLSKMKAGEPTYLEQGSIWTSETLPRLPR